MAGSAFGAGTIHMAQGDQQSRLTVLYELAAEAGTARIKRFHGDGTLSSDFGPIPLADGFAVSGNEVGAGLTADGETLYLAAGEYVAIGNRAILIVKVRLEDDGTAIVTNRWATAVSGLETSPGGGSSISGAALALCGTAPMVVVGTRVWPGTGGFSCFSNLRGTLVPPGEEVVIPFVSGPLVLRSSQNTVSANRPSSGPRRLDPAAGSEPRCRLQ